MTYFREEQLSRVLSKEETKSRHYLLDEENEVSMSFR